MMTYLLMSIRVLAVEVAGVLAIAGAFFIYDKTAK